VGTGVGVWVGGGVFVGVFVGVAVGVLVGVAVGVSGRPASLALATANSLSHTSMACIASNWASASS
jgi:hypothetical protein